MNRSAVEDFRSAVDDFRSTLDDSRLAPPAAGRTDVAGWVVPAVSAGVVLVLLAGLALVRHGLRPGGT